jgi:mannan endo-1,4-beta-mannosidase
MIDTVGADISPSQGDHSSQVSSFNFLRDLFNGKKIVALTECGSIPSVDNMESSSANWTYFMP